MDGGCERSVDARAYCQEYVTQKKIPIVIIVVCLHSIAKAL